MSEGQAGSVLLALAAAGLVLVRLRGTGVAPLRVAAVVLVAAVAALGLAAARLAAIDGGAYRGPIGRRATVTGFVVAVPRRSFGEVRVEVATPDGKLLLSAHEPVPDLPTGSEVRATGVLAEPDPYLASTLHRHGIAEALDADRVELTGGRRGGLQGLLDGIRSRAIAAVDRGLGEREAAVARGFALGEDDRIDPQTSDDFQRSGLQHHLAVSGENVLLLAILAMPLLAIAGLSLRARFVCVLALIAIYVPVCGATPSIQRAGIMGAAGVVAALAGRPRSRLYAVLLAAFVTLALNPRVEGDVGWQLSFAAVIGIFLWTHRIAALLPGGDSRGWQRALAEGAAMTIAATIATAPLMAHSFDRVSVLSLPANLVALPAVAPAMWLGMLSAAAGQFPVIATVCVPLNAAHGLVIAYIEQVAHWFAAPPWAVASVRLASWPSVIGAYAVLGTCVWLALRAAERRRDLEPGGRRLLRPRLALAAVLFAVAVLAAGPSLLRSRGAAAAGAAEFRVSILDVGQGDAILLRPPGAEPVLVDGGPPGDDLGRLLADHGVERLGAALLTHEQSDHAGGILDILGRVPIGALDYAEAGPVLLGEAVAAGTRPQRLAAGDELRFGELRLDVLWPPRNLLTEEPMDAAHLDQAGIDPNRLCLVVLAEWRHFSILLTGDAEEELAPVQPGQVDVL
ncbi:MAG: competence protein ComEC, partial [Solirubrobacterales bacterium]|nr:competence protein ComEC [Solirubrobacterales bacterium]